MKKILLADDDHVTLEFMSMFLRQCNFLVDPVEDGTELLKHLDESVDIIITDIQMPYLDGLSAVTLIHQYSEFHIPVIAVTALGPNELPKDHSFDCVLYKPIRFEDLIQILNERGIYVEVD